MKVAIKMPTICVKCKHHRFDEGFNPVTSPSETWYWHTCGAKSTIRILNHTTGQYEMEKRPYCREVNSGSCTMWEPEG